MAGTIPGAPVGGNSRLLVVAPEVNDEAAYEANDAIGGLLEFAGAALEGPNSGVVLSLTLIDRASQKADLDLVLFRREFTPTADGSAFDPDPDELLECVGVIPIREADYAEFAENSVATIRNVGLLYDLGAGFTSLYGQLVSRGMPEYDDAADVQIALHCLLD